MFSYLSPETRVRIRCGRSGSWWTRCSPPTVSFRGVRRSNEAHESKTDPDARWRAKANGRSPCGVTAGICTAERDAALMMLEKNTRRAAGDGWGRQSVRHVRVCGRVPKSAGGAARDAELGRRGGSKSRPTCVPRSMELDQENHKTRLPTSLRTPRTVKRQASRGPTASGAIKPPGYGPSSPLRRPAQSQQSNSGFSRRNCVVSFAEILSGSVVVTHFQSPLAFS